MKFSVLSSGSRANCTFLEAAGTRVLIDCGLSATEAVRRLLYIGIEPASINAILLTHEHRDHIYGVSTLSRRFSIPVYVNKKTKKHLPRVHAFELFTTGTPFELNHLTVNPFKIDHDAADPVAFTIHGEGLTFAHVTDLGCVTPTVRESIEKANALVLESNHDSELLRSCGYPWPLVQRISSSQGHLSNETAAALVAEVLHPELSHLVLGHLSENSNTPDLALSTLQQHIDPSAISIVTCGSVTQPTALFDVMNY